ncbi:hypothetical protein ACFM35_07010 [Microbacterium sp. P01]|uniref:hypothetical protein n=1 Tax=Microbacterium sp. P01 TaxID=3366261 RepID=UPI003672CFDA
MIRRIAAAVATLVVATAVLSGCIGQPAPAESTPLFSSEDEAFAAAEQTYRNYVDALNQVDLSDPSTFEPVYAWTTGDLNAQDRKNFSSWHASDWTKTGVATVSAVEQAGASQLDTLTPMMLIDACYHVADVIVTDAQGESVVDPSRPDVQHLRIELESGPSDTGLVVEAITPSPGPTTC